VTIGVLSFDIHLPTARSLKDRRQVVRRLKDRLRSRHNAAVVESSEHTDLWQRAGLIVVSVASGRDALERLFDTMFREAEALVPGTLLETQREFLDSLECGIDDSSDESLS
jgi:uncharacterized protein YlxP (DUF503 family)